MLEAPLPSVGSGLAFPLQRSWLSRSQPGSVSGTGLHPWGVFVLPTWPRLPVQLWQGQPRQADTGFPTTSPALLLPPSLA